MTGYRDLESALLYGYEVERQYVCQNHPDHNASASVNALTGLFVCYACGHAGRVDPNSLHFDAEGVLRFTREIEDKATKVNPYTETYLNLFDSTGPGDYWLSRFDTRTCRNFRLGHATGVATYPMRDETGAVLGIVTRDTTGTREQKYKYPPRVSVSDHLIEAWRCTAETIVLVEGMADVAAVWEAGFDCALGSYKAGLSKAQAAILRRYAPTRVLCAFDQDTAGDAGWVKVRDQLRYCSKVQRVEWDTYNDVAEIPLSDRRDMLTELVGQRAMASVA
jgi:DNA primase